MVSNVWTWGMGPENRTWEIWNHSKWDMNKSGTDKNRTWKKLAPGQDLVQDQVKDQVQGLVQDLEPDIVFNEDHGI